ncbi:hypothetical protein, partial [Miniimonas arenae]|uniref:hypothetical protein n=1 Tax=Miniimonas arenae TaxID=676201 RepID=UPI0028AFBCCD
MPDQAGIGEAKLADVQATPARDEDSSVVVSPPNEASTPVVHAELGEAGTAVVHSERGVVNQREACIAVMRA